MILEGARSDPALEVGGDGRSLLQTRLGLLGKVLILVAMGYWPIYFAMWALEPSVGLGRAWAHVLSPDVVVLTGVYALLWLFGRGKTRPVKTLLIADMGFSFAVGAALAYVMLNDLGTLSGVFENLVSLICFLALRSLIVPSTVRRTILCGVLMSLPTVAGVGLGPDRFVGESLSRSTMMGFSLNWSALAIAFSSVASGVLYGLRRQVRDARRLGQYTLIEKLGEGGMGVVYRASHAMLRRPTAIKLLSDRGDASLVRFEQEVQLLAGLNHPNTVTIHDYGRTADGAFYYAMELLDGMDLEKLVAQGGPQPASRVIHILAQALRGLAEAHAVGLVHRDIKPANIFLCKRWGEPDAVKVLDFGLAKNLAAAPRREVTGSQTVLGTPLYISPEALAGAVHADVRSDIYSLGAVAYYMLTGVAVFEGRTAIEVCANHIHMEPVRPSVRVRRPIPLDLEEVVLRCLAKCPDERFASAAEVSAALGACVNAGEWSARDAERWWERNDGKREAPPSPGLAATIEIDATRRSQMMSVESLA